MLTELRIRNLAVIEAVTFPVRSGFNVLTGETGAGKSIIVEALGLLLGERGGADLVRTGADRATVEGTFEIGALPELSRELDARGITTEGGLLVLRREVNTSGKSRAWINDTTVTAGTLSVIGGLLVSLHGQHDSQGLLREETQRDMLDAFAGAVDEAATVREVHARLEAVRAARQDLERRREEASRRADYLRHVVSEIEAANPVVGELENLDDEARRLTHAVELGKQVSIAVAALEDPENGALHISSLARRAIGQIMRLDGSALHLGAAMDTAMVSLADIARELAVYGESLESDPGRLEEIDRRREQLHDLARKYGGDVEAVLDTLRLSQDELNMLDSAELDLRGLAAEEQAASEKLITCAARLSAARREAAVRLSDGIGRLLPGLGLPGGRLIVQLEPRNPIEPTGAEVVRFQTAFNEGLDPRPLEKSASGGELSRLMLALETVLARNARVPTLVFDEVDAGIGGTVALRVGETLRHLAAYHQVLVITHLAQVAARAHTHVVVAKGATGGVTTADIAVVTGELRVAEVARMLGGDPSSELSRAHAAELLEIAAQTHLADTPERPQRRRRKA